MKIAKEAVAIALDEYFYEGIDEAIHEYEEELKQ